MSLKKNYILNCTINTQTQNALQVFFDVTPILAINDILTIQEVNVSFLIAKENLELILPQIFLKFESGLNNSNDGFVFNVTSGSANITTQSYTFATVIPLSLDNILETELYFDTSYYLLTYKNNIPVEIQLTGTIILGKLHAFDYRKTTTDNGLFWELTPTSQFPLLKELKNFAKQVNPNNKTYNNVIVTLNVKKN